MEVVDILPVVRCFSQWVSPCDVTRCQQISQCVLTVVQCFSQWFYYAIVPRPSLYFPQSIELFNLNFQSLEAVDDGGETQSVAGILRLSLDNLGIEKKFDKICIFMVNTPTRIQIINPPKYHKNTFCHLCFHIRIYENADLANLFQCARNYKRSAVFVRFISRKYSTRPTH